MLRPPKTDLWRVGVLPAPIAQLMEPKALQTMAPSAVWLPDPGPWRYLADPFGVVRDGSVHVFVEAYDYRTKHAVIEHHELTAGGAWRGGELVLSGAAHLSYPFVLEEGGETWMVPESHQAGEVALYRARRFPDDWVRETVLLDGVPAAEPSILHHDGCWWMFFTVVGPKARDQRELHIAHAPALTGPWTLHPLNPVLEDLSGARPGGTPFVDAEGVVVLPVQDCSQTYGGAVRFLRFPDLAKSHVRCEHLPWRLTGNLLLDSHADGLHTFAACGGYTLVDVKRVDRTRGRGLVDFQRRWRKWTKGR